MPVCLRCGNSVGHREDFLGWKLITKEGSRRVTSRDIQFDVDAFFDHPDDMIWENERMVGLCPDCLIYKNFKVSLVKRIEVTIQAMDVHDMIRVSEDCYPDFKYEGHEITSDNTS